MGAGRDATMVTPRPGAGPLSDAPTMLHRPVADDEFPDPYGAPVPQQGGAYRGGAAGGWDERADGFDRGTQYGAGNNYSAGTYGAAAGGAYGGDQRRYDEPTGMYQPQADQNDGYDRGFERGGRGQYGGGAGAAGAYQGGGYEQQAGYDDRGYDSGNGYGPQPGGGSYAGGTYGGAAQQYGGGYDEGRDDYREQAGQDQRGGAGYGRGAAHDDGREGYDQRGGYGGQPRPQEPSQPGQRRSLDWMDN
jgi:hypothetical protein